VQHAALDDGRWQGHRPFLVDGSTCAMPASAGPPGGVRSIDGAAAGGRRSRGAPPGPLPCGPRGAPEARRRAPAHPRSRPGTGGPPGRPPRGCARGRSGPVCRHPLCPPGSGRRPRRVARRRAADRRLHPGPALRQAKRAADAGGHRPPTLPLAQSARHPGPTGGVVETDDLSLVAHPSSLGRFAGDAGAPSCAGPTNAGGSTPHGLSSKRACRWLSCPVKRHQGC
jgi:hypothetical protein